MRTSLAGQPVQAPQGAASDEQLIAMLVDRARSEGLQLTGEGGLLQQLTKRVLESALEGEITDHLGYDKHDPAGKNSGNSRNGTRSKTVLTDVGPVEVKVPRDRDGTFEPQIVKKRQRRLTGVDEMVLSLSAKGLTHGEISAHLAEVYGAEVSKQTISTITDKVMDGMAEWQNRPLDRVYPVLFIDAINVKIRDGQVANRPIYVVMAVTVEGTRDILGHLGRRRRRGRQVLAAGVHRAEEPRRRRRADAGLRRAEGPARRGRDRLAPHDRRRPASFTCCATASVTRPARTGTRSPRRSSPSTPRRPRTRRGAVPGVPARPGARSIRRSSSCGRTPGPSSCPSSASTSRSARSSARTNAIESVNARIRKAVRARGHFPNEAAALKCVYMALMSLDPTGKGRKRWTMRWKAPLNAFQIAFEGRLTPTAN